MPDLLGLLSDNKITLRSLRAGHSEQVLCPDCQGGRTREKSLTVTIDADGAGFVALCHRGHCGHRMGFRVHDAPAVERQVARQQPKPPPAVSAEAASYRPDWLFDFFAKRNIGAKTVVDLGIYASRHWFGEQLGELPCIVFPYVFKGELVNRKYRPEPGKKPQAQDKNALQTIYNVDALGESPFEVVWVEGEPDVAAMRECGVIAVSLKDGAPAPPKNGATPADSDGRFEALRTHEKLLTGVQRFVLAGDNDVPGLWLREELGRRLGRHRCVLVTWPDGCKDAGDVLRLHGPDAVLSALAAAEPYPISGLQKAKPGTLRSLRALPPPRTMTTGARATDDILRLPTEGRLIVVTGFPGSGKTSWTRFVMVHTAADTRRRWAVFSPEMQPWESFLAECAEAWIGKPFYPTAAGCMTEAEIDEAERWLSDRITMLVCDGEGDAPTQDWLLERATAAVLRDGVTDLEIDPWNEVEHDRGSMTEAEYLSRALQRWKGFAYRHGCNVWILVHPKTPLQTKPGEVRPAPGPYDCNGGAMWFNKCDIGITVHSPEDGRADICLWKSRFKRWGRGKTMATLRFDRDVGRYSTPEVEADELLRGHWTGADS